VYRLAFFLSGSVEDNIGFLFFGGEFVFLLNLILPGVFFGMLEPWAFPGSLFPLL